MDDWEKPDAKLGVVGRETPELVDEDPDCPAQECMTWTFGDFRSGSANLKS